jgi:hypoxanthine phosphoribosyltransferase
VSAVGDVLLDAGELRALAARLAGEISADHPEGVVLVGVLSGCLCFLADLCRRLSVPCRVDFLALSAFGGAATRVRVLKDLDLDVSGCSVVLVEDIVDTGLSARYVAGLLSAHGAAQVEICTLLDRPGRRIVPVPLRYVGIEAPDDFLIGYGLDFAGRYRNLPSLHRADVARLEADLGAPGRLFSLPGRQSGPVGGATAG